jgi:hypothetical protein
VANGRFSQNWRNSAFRFVEKNHAEAEQKCSQALGIYEEILEVLFVYLSGLENLPPQKLRLVDEELTKRLELSSVVIQSLPAIEYSLFSSSYATLAALLKQETDALTRLQEYQVGKAKDGKTPNTGIHGTPAQRFFLKGLQPWAHLSQSIISEYLSWHIENERLQLKRWPVFDEVTFNKMCDVRCHSLAVLIIRLEQVFGDAYEMRLSEALVEQLKEPVELLRLRIENEK